MSDQKKEPPAKCEGAVGGCSESTLVLGLESPTVENQPAFAIEDMFPDSIEKMVFYQVTLKKYLNSLRDLIRKQIDTAQKYAEKKGIPWDKYLQQRKEDITNSLDWNADDVIYLEDWKDEQHLPECNRTLAIIKYVHLCRWTLHKSIEKYYKGNPEAPRHTAHSKQQTPESFSAFDEDSESHIGFVENKHCEQEFEEKSAVVVFNRCGPSVLTEKQIRSLEAALERFLGPQENKYAKHWAQEAVKMTLETNDQTLADVPSITEVQTGNQTTSGDGTDSTAPPAPHTSYASSLEKLKEVHILSRRDTLSGIPPLPKDTPSPEDSSIDQSEEVSPGHTGENTEDEATSPEEPTDRRKQYSHKHSRARFDEGNVDTD